MLEATLGVPLTVLVLALLAAGARFILAPAVPNIRGIISTAVLAIFLVVVCHHWLEESGMSQGKQRVALAMLSFFARDILSIGIRLLEQVLADPMGALRDYLNHRNSRSNRDD